MKLEMWREKVNDGSFNMFESLSKVLPSPDSISFMKNLVADHLSRLACEFQQYFPNLNDTDLKLVRNPFKLTLAGIDSAMQEELIDLLNNSGARDRFENCVFSKFWCSSITSYPKLSQVALKALLIFPSSYKCEQEFSSLLYMKSKYRSRLNVGDDLRVSLPVTEPNIKQLTDAKQTQPFH
ncbi:zinc finger BED domain-containing protein 5-like [Watersipora subatra]|uniref:zinc finger BED domain-containing protein 5-like n=1 Tax=Watersipora subatra TaxID=2589382 RepID=UPI00355B176D